MTATVLAGSAVESATQHRRLRREASMDEQWHLATSMNKLLDRFACVEKRNGSIVARLEKLERIFLLVDWDNFELAITQHMKINSDTTNCDSLVDVALLRPECETLPEHPFLIQPDPVAEAARDMQVLDDLMPPDVTPELPLLQAPPGVTEAMSPMLREYGVSPGSGGRRGDPWPSYSIDRLHLSDEDNNANRTTDLADAAHVRSCVSALGGKQVHTSDLLLLASDQGNVASCQRPSGSSTSASDEHVDHQGAVASSQRSQPCQHDWLEPLWQELWQKARAEAGLL